MSTTQYIAAGIPEFRRHVEWTDVQDVADDGTFKKARNYFHGYAVMMGNSPLSAWVGGGKHNGKTMLSVLTLKDVMRYGMSGLILRSRDLATLLRREANPHDADIEHVRRILQRARSCDLFVLDDIGSEYRTADTVFVQYGITDLLTVRSTVSLKQTIVTSRLQPNEIADRYGGDYGPSITEFAGTCTKVDFGPVPSFSL